MPTRGDGARNGKVERVKKPKTSLEIIKIVNNFSVNNYSVITVCFKI
jgi:hypothetical protein